MAYTKAPRPIIFGDISESSDEFRAVQQAYAEDLKRQQDAELRRIHIRPYNPDLIEVEILSSSDSPNS